MSTPNLDRVTLENVNWQFCSDWLKSELTRLLKIEKAANDLDRAMAEFGIEPSDIADCAQILHDVLHTPVEK